MEDITLVYLRGNSSARHLVCNNINDILSPLRKHYPMFSLKIDLITVIISLKR